MRGRDRNKERWSMRGRDRKKEEVWEGEKEEVCGRERGSIWETERKRQYEREIDRKRKYERER